MVFAESFFNISKTKILQINFYKGFKNWTSIYWGFLKTSSTSPRQKSSCNFEHLDTTCIYSHLLKIASTSLRKDFLFQQVFDQNLLPKIRFCWRLLPSLRQKFAAKETSILGHIHTYNMYLLISAEDIFLEKIFFSNKFLTRLQFPTSFRQEFTARDLHSGTFTYSM